MGPDGWSEVRLGDVFAEVADRNNRERLPVLAVTLDRGVVRRDSLDRKMDREVEQDAYLRALPGDIAYNTMRMWQGGSGLVREAGFVSPAYTVLRARGEECPEFWAHAFKAPDLIDSFRAFSQGVAKDRHRLYYDQFAAVRTRRPPVAEQRKIAAILSSVDETIEKTEAVIAQLDVVKKAMLEELLTRGIPGRHSRFKQTEIGEVPEEWPLVPLGDAGRWLSGGTPSKATPEFWNGEIPWVSPKDMKVSRIADAIDHVSEAAIGSGTILAPARSILIVIRGMILVHSVPVALTTRPVAFNQDMKALVVNDAFVPEFLLYWLQSKAPAILQLVDVANHGTKRLPSPLLFALPLPQPSRHEQEQVCEVLAAVDRRIDSETKVLSSLASTKQNLSASLLSGETRVVGALTEAR